MGQKKFGIKFCHGSIFPNHVVETSNTSESIRSLNVLRRTIARLVWRVDSEGLVFYDGSIPGRMDTSDASEVISGAVSAGCCDLIMRTLVP